MAGKSITHSDDWWLVHAPRFVLRCEAHYKSTGGQCRRVAVDGSVVCDQHGGAAAQVRRRAAERIAITADDAAQRLVEWMNDPGIDMRERVKIAHDMLDRGGLAATQLLKIMPVTEDPIEALFASILADPLATFDPAPQEAARALEASRSGELAELIGTFEDDDIVDAEIVEDDGVVVPLPVRDGKAPKRRNPAKPPKHVLEGLGLI